MDDKIRAQVAEWHESDSHQEIINALEQIPAAKRDYETIGLLARAYNNVDDYAKAIELLESVREEGEGDALWNFRMGYACFYQERIPDALQYFTAAHELDGEDEDTIFFIRRCNIEMPLAGRVENFWNWFVENEQKLSEMMHPSNDAEAEDFMAFVNEGASLISDKMYFNLGGDNEFTFSVEGWPDLFIIYPYIISRMPECLKANWKFYPFNQGTDHPFGFRMYGAEIDTANIMVRAKYNEDKNDFSIAYHDKNLNTLPRNESDNAFWIILEHTLGEGISFEYVKEAEPTDDCDECTVPIDGLKDHIKEVVESHGKKFYENPKDMYTTYHLNPEESDELRFDVVVGSTCIESLVAEYYNDSTELFDHINDFGAQAVYIAYPNGDVEDSNDIVSMRHDIQDRIAEEILEPMNLGQVIGGATGVGSSYIDLIVYDIYAFVDAVKPLLMQYPTHSFYLSDFRQHARLTRLTEAQNQ